MSRENRNRVIFANVINKLIGWSPTQYDQNPYKKRKMPLFKTRQQGEYHGMSDAETRVMQL
jgi:hypothetical protein